MSPDADFGLGQPSKHPDMVQALLRNQGVPPPPLKQRLFALPVAEAIGVFAAAAPRVPRRRDLLRYGREVIGVPEPDLHRWYTQAWWGTFANAACENRLIVKDRIKEVLDLVNPVDWSPLDALEAEGKGVLLIGAHWGVHHVTSALLHHLGRHVMRVGVFHPHNHHPNADLSPKDSQAGLMRLYLQAFNNLRKGGLAVIIPDGTFWRNAVDATFFGRPCKVSPAAATLARLTGAPGLPSRALWDGQRIRIEFAPIIAPGTGDPEAADRAWMRQYLDWVESTARTYPTAVCFNQLLPRVLLSPEATRVDQ